MVKTAEVVAREGKGLDEREFRLVLRLIALAQVRGLCERHRDYYFC